MLTGDGELKKRGKRKEKIVQREALCCYQLKR
jgi:hypothetical protein